MEALEAGKDTVLTVVHLGDSHIQAGYLTGRMMRLLQQQFGNAGRGWVSPLKLSNTNEPDDYFITSTVSPWVAGRCIQTNRKCSIGMGGMGIRTEANAINLNLIIAPKNGAGYAFNQAVLYRHAQADALNPSDTTQQTTIIPFQTDSFFSHSEVIADTFRLNQLVDTLRLNNQLSKHSVAANSTKESKENVFFGFNLTNGQPGILYHSIGINGAMYENYSDPEYLKKLAMLKPDLLIISLGTNETFGRNFKSAEFSDQVRRFLQLAKEQLPGVEIVLTTPPECYKRIWVEKKRNYVRNPNTLLAATSIAKIAKEEELSCWDLFETTGGKGSCVKWQQQRLMGRDRVHFNKEGYYEQGTLFFRALMQSYNQFKQIQDVR